MQRTLKDLAGWKIRITTVPLMLSDSTFHATSSALCFEFIYKNNGTTSYSGGETNPLDLGVGGQEFHCTVTQNNEGVASGCIQ